MRSQELDGDAATYTIRRYPAHLIDVLWLPEGTRLIVRPTLPQDVDLQREFFRELSAKSRHARFMARLNDVSPALLERFATIDYSSHVALLASSFDAKGRERMVAEARYVLDETDRAACEFAIAVADAKQRYGLGSALLARLVRQATWAGVQRMKALTECTNTPMLRLAERAGFSIAHSPGEAGIMVLQKDIARTDIATFKADAGTVPPAMPARTS